MPILILLIFFATNSHALYNPRVLVNTNDKFVMHQQNNTGVDSIAANQALVGEVVDMHKKCEEKGFIYLGAGATNVDADNCYDISGTTNPDTEFRTTFTTLLGAPTMYHFYGGGSAGAPLGRFAADKACNAKQAGSRALVYDDLRYVLRDLNTTELANTPIWVYDSVHSYTNASANLVMSKNEDAGVAYAYDCNGWNTSSTSTKGTILKVKSTPDNTFFAIDYQTCGTLAYIACVYN